MGQHNIAPKLIGVYMNRILLITFTFLLSLNLSAENTDYQKHIESIKTFVKNNKQDIINFCENIDDRKHAQSCANLGLVAYVNGDLEEALYYLEKACESKIGSSCFNKGLTASMMGEQNMKDRFKYNEIAYEAFYAACLLNKNKSCMDSYHFIKNKEFRFSINELRILSCKHHFDETVCKSLK
jgi:tetratricopeptide (TPR) repeat protein